MLEAGKWRRGESSGDVTGYGEQQMYMNSNHLQSRQAENSMIMFLLFLSSIFFYSNNITMRPKLVTRVWGISSLNNHSKPNPLKTTPQMQDQPDSVHDA